MLATVHLHQQILQLDTKGWIKSNPIVALIDIPVFQSSKVFHSIIISYDNLSQ